MYKRQPPEYIEPHLLDDAPGSPLDHTQPIAEAATIHPCGQTARQLQHDWDIGLEHLHRTSAARVLSGAAGGGDSDDSDDAGGASNQVNSYGGNTNHGNRDGHYNREGDDSNWNLQVDQTVGELTQYSGGRGSETLQLQEDYAMTKPQLTWAGSHIQAGQQPDCGLAPVPQPVPQPPQVQDQVG